MKYRLRDGDGSETTIEAGCDKGAREQARAWVRNGDWDTSGGTIWVDVWLGADDPDSDEKLITVAVDPQPPACPGGEHDWQSPYEILGGLEENPGVWGHGGGVIIREVCMHCGSERVTDTWAQRPDTGEQGLRSVRYEEGKHADEVRELRGEAES